MFFLRVVSGLRGVPRLLRKRLSGRGIQCFPSPAGRPDLPDFRSAARKASLLRRERTLLVRDRSKGRCLTTPQGGRSADR
ncbi:hypothetical protein DA2_2676 [Desulfovibrio sp. A2]|nr:hypothetical protein DA2_2676 [Desulfovibrio sp. A2]